MSQLTSHGIPEQQASYRRGLVLGLTMAEVGILIIFVLLLLLAFGEWMRERDQLARQSLETISKTQLDELKNADAVLKSLAAEIGLGPNASPDEITKLVRTVHEVASRPEGQSMLARAKEELRRLKEATARVELLAFEVGSNDPAALSERVEQQSYELANKEGQLQRYETQLRQAGLGKGERPCWVKPDGTIEYLFDVVLQSDGIRIREYNYPARAAERELLSFPQSDPTEVLSLEQFARRTAPLFDHSLAQNCRFFVVIYDSTQPTEKELYKRLLRTVEGHFYKRLDRGSAPF